MSEFSSWVIQHIVRTKFIGEITYKSAASCLYLHKIEKNALDFNSESEVKNFRVLGCVPWV